MTDAAEGAPNLGIIGRDYAKVSSPEFRWPDDEEERRALSPIQTWTWDAP